MHDTQYKNVRLPAHKFRHRSTEKGNLLPISSLKLRNFVHSHKEAKVQ